MQNSDEIELGQIIRTLRRWLWLIITCTLLAGIAAFIATRLITPQYEAKATLMIDPAKDARTSEYNLLVAGERLALTYSQMVKSQPILQEVASRIGVENNQKLADQIRAEPIPDTQLIRLTVKDPSPEQAALLANTIAEELIVYLQQLQAERYAASLESMQAQLATLSKQADEAQEKLNVVIEQKIKADVELSLRQNDLDDYRIEYRSLQPNGTEAQIDEYALKIEQAQKEIETLTATVIQAETDQARLESQINQLRSDLRTLQQEFDNMNLSMVQAADSVVITEPAQPPMDPIQNDLLYIGLATIVGLFIGVGAAFLLETMDDTIKTSDDVSHKLGLSTIGTIGLLTNGERGLVVDTKPRSLAAESFRILAANIRYASLDKPLKTLLVTSPQPKEGKTLVASNLAIAISQTEDNVVLVDADLRLPEMHELFEIEQFWGLTDSILKNTVEGTLRTIHPERLSVLTSGEVPPNPTEVIGSQRMKKILKDLTHQAKIVVIDSSPLLLAADAKTLATEVDGVLLVVRAGLTATQAAREAVQSLRQVKANIVGVVLNAEPGKRKGYYYYSNHDGRTRPISRWQRWRKILAYKIKGLARKG